MKAETFEFAFGGWLIVLPIPPVPAARAKIRRYGGGYYPKRYREYRDRVAGLLKAAGKLPHYTKEQPVWVASFFIAERPKKPANDYPVGDIDNYEKAILDALTDVDVLVDDVQVVATQATKRYAEPGKEKPRVEVYIHEKQDRE